MPLLGTTYVLITAIPPRFCNHAWLYYVTEAAHPDTILACRVFENRGPFRHAVDIILELQGNPDTCDYIVPCRGSEIGEKGLLYTYEDYCVKCLRELMYCTMEQLRAYLFQALFGIHSLRKTTAITHGNLHQGNILLHYSPWVGGRRYLDDGDTWNVPCKYSIRFSDFSQARRDVKEPTDLLFLEVSFGKVPLRDGSPQDQAMWADVRRKMMALQPLPDLLRHNFFYKYRTFREDIAKQFSDSV